MSYRRRQSPIHKVCQQCQSSFETWHAGRIYCSQACNMTAWRQRHKLPLGATTPQPASVSKPVSVSQPVSNAVDPLSLANLWATTAGSLLADGIETVFSGQPTPADLLKRIEVLEYNIGRGMGAVVTHIKGLEDHNKAVEQSTPMLAVKVAVVRNKRLSGGK